MFIAVESAIIVIIRHLTAFVDVDRIPQYHIRVFVDRFTDQRIKPIAGNKVVAVDKSDIRPFRLFDTRHPGSKQPPIFLMIYYFDPTVTRGVFLEYSGTTIGTGIIHADHFQIPITLGKYAVKTPFQPFFRIIHGNNYR